jgi:signal transduction histidine kinase
MKPTSKILFTLSLCWMSVLFVLGGWWLYLLSHIQDLMTIIGPEKLSKMLFWEGSVFITLLILLSLSLLFFYLKDQSKTKSLQAFFASLTHELKTPLASIKLQAEVIDEIINDSHSESKQDQQLKILLGRMTKDTVKLETQMDKILQLSRIERGGELNLTTINLKSFIRKMSKDWEKDFDVKITTPDESIKILADEFALELILKNLFENTQIHSKNKLVDIKISTNQNFSTLIYDDHGVFKGDIKKLSTLFYKFNSSKGSGIGLYLISRLMNKMLGNFEIISFHEKQQIHFRLTFKNSEADNA